MSRVISIVACILVLLLQVTTVAEWRVEFESKTVGMNQTDVNLRLKVYWDAEMIGLAVPLVVREITPGSFWTGTLPCDTMHGTPERVTWNWSNPSWANLIQEVKPGPGCATPGNQYDGISPDNLSVVAVGLTNGIAAEPLGREILTLEFDVTGQPGQFEIDTACIVLSLDALYLYDHSYPSVNHGPTGIGDCTFGKGVVTIAECYCPGQGDLNDNGILNLVDLAYLMSYIFHDGAPILADPLCPALNRGDWNADGRLNLIDIVSLLSSIFRDPELEPVDPCSP